MSKNCLDESCVNCQYYNPDEHPLYCNFTGSTIKCSILNGNVEIIKFKEKLI